MPATYLKTLRVRATGVALNVVGSLSLLSPAVAAGPPIAALGTTAGAPADASSVHGAGLTSLSPADVTTIASIGYVWGYPTVDLYRIMYEQALDPKSGLFLAPLNNVGNFRNVATPQDTATISPNVDTPYSYAWLDLRQGPVIITVPPFAANRYMSIELFDLYTYILGYVSPRTNGHVGGDFMVAPPGWPGPKPKGVKKVFLSTTTLALGLFRTQLFRPDDLNNVHAIQDRFQVRTLAEYIGQQAVPPDPLPPLVAPVDLRKDPTSIQFYTVLDWMMQFMPVLADEQDLRARLARIGIEAGRRFDPPAPLQSAVVDGMREALGQMQQRALRVRSSSELFGSREFLKQDDLTRATGAMLGILGNAQEEFLGVGWQADVDGKPFDGTKRYSIHFAQGDLPPVGAFWSITAYTAQKLLYANPLERYAINSPMLPSLTRGPNGGITIYVQHDSPGKDLESNWLPVPDGPFGLTFRTYEPSEAIRDGRWRAPPVVPVK